MNSSYPLESDPIKGKRRNPKPISEGHLPPRDAFDQEVDNAARENRPVDRDKLREAFYGGLSTKVPRPLPEHPAARAEAIASYGDYEGKEEFEHRLMHRLLVRQFPMASIANVMGISVRQAYRIKDRLRRAYISHVKEKDYYEVIGHTIWCYDEWIASTLRTNTDMSVPVRYRMMALRMANEIMTSRVRFLDLVGLFEHGVVKGFENKNSDQEEVDKTLLMLSEILNSALKESDTNNGN